MQTVAELVEKRADVIMRQQCRVIANRRLEVADQIRDRCLQGIIAGGGCWRCLMWLNAMRLGRMAAATAAVIQTEDVSKSR